jgi:3-methyl-2-oxobutanoate hydroxymethyltransferase
VSTHKEIKRITTQTLQDFKENGEKISMLTAYDFSMAGIVDRAGIDVILVGDSARMLWPDMKLRCRLP